MLIILLSQTIRAIIEILGKLPTIIILKLLIYRKRGLILHLFILTEIGQLQQVMIGVAGMVHGVIPI